MLPRHCTSEFIGSICMNYFSVFFPLFKSSAIQNPTDLKHFGSTHILNLY